MPEEQKTVDVGEQSETENSVEVELDSSAKPSAEEELVQGELSLEKEESEDSEELETYSESVQKRISKLTAKMREAERREKAALDYAKGVKTQLDQTEARTSSLDHSLVTEFENRVTAQEEVFKSQLRDAIDRGDVDAQVTAQKNLATIAADSERLKYAKQQQESRAQVQPQAQAQVQPQPRTPTDPKAQEWASRNDWFGKNEPMTLTAFSIHKALVEIEGFDPYSDEYYSEVDSRMRKEFPNKFEGNGEITTARTARRSPTVASAGRSSSRAGKKSVKLNASQVAIAKKLGVSLEQYAKQVALLETREG